MKKKLISVLAAVMILSFGTTAFAANSPVAGNVVEDVKENTEQKANVSSVATDVKTTTANVYRQDGTDLKADQKALDQKTIDNATAVVKEQLKDAVNVGESYIGGTKGDAFAANAKDGSKEISATIVSAVDVTTDAEVSAQNPVRVKFLTDGVKAADTLLILHYNTTTGKWENIPVAEQGDGWVSADFTSLSPVVIVKLSADTKAAGSDNANTTTTTTTDTTTTTPADGTAVSPKTGAEMPVVAILAVIFAAGAVVCTKKVKFN